MRLPLALVFGALLGSAHAAGVAPRQDDGGSGGSGGSGGGSASPAPGPSTNPPQQTSSSVPPTQGGDTTTTITTTVSGKGDVATVTETTTIGSTIVSTLTSTKTEYSTTTVTKSDSDVETSIVYQDVSVTGKKKRENVPRTAAAEPTAAVNNLHKRATITQVETVTAGGGSSTTTVLRTVAQDVVSNKVETSTTTEVVTVTKQANAKTTTTVTSYRTQTAVPTGVETSQSTSDPSSSGSSGGLSTGAKAGIGAGVGVGGLLVIGALIFCCMRRRRSPKADPDMMAGASEVPVGAGSGGGPGSRPMSHNSSNPGAYLAAARPPVHKVSPEGYRGTAMGDGRAGYAKPNPYGSAYTPSRSTTTTVPSQGVGADSLPEHPHPGGETVMAAVGGNTISPVSRGSSAPGVAPISTPSPQPQHPMAAELGTDNTAANKWHTDNAAEIDSQPAMSHQSGPVYEMPTEPYR